MDPKQLQPLLDMPPPSNGAELQQFICAANWMRMAIPDFNQMVEPLTTLLEETLTIAGRRTKTGAPKISLMQQWNPAHDDCYAKVKRALAESVTLAHPHPEKLFCLFTDAS